MSQFDNLPTNISPGQTGHAAIHNATNAALNTLANLPFKDNAGFTLASQALIDAALVPIISLIGSNNGDADSVVNTVREVLAVMANIPEGLNLLNRLASIDSAITASLSRANHTGTQTASTISDLSSVITTALAGDPASVVLNVDTINSFSGDGSPASPLAINITKEQARINALVDQIVPSLSGTTLTFTYPSGKKVNITLPSSSGGGTLTPGTYSALTSSGFTNKIGGQVVTFFDSATPPYVQASSSDWGSGDNTGKWNLKLAAGQAGGIRFLVNDLTSLFQLNLTLTDTVEHENIIADAGIFANNGKVGYVLKTTGDVTSSVSVAVGEYVILYSDGSSLKAYRSVDGTTLTTLVYTYTNITPATQALFLGLAGHNNGKLYSPAQAGFSIY